MKAIIVGGGIMGLSTAWGLAREGHEVELFEQGALPNPLASSMDEHRLIRHPYGDHTGYARMIDRCLSPPGTCCGAISAQRLYAPTGTLALTGNGADWAERSAAQPGGDRPADDRAHARRAAAALSAARRQRRRARLLDRHRRRAVRAGHRRGARPSSRDAARTSACTPNTPVRSVDLERGRVTRKSGATHDADIVVVAAGAWVGRLLPHSARALVPSRQIVIYFRPAGRAARGVGQGADDHREDRRRRPLPRAADGRPRLQGRRPRVQPHAAIPTAAATRSEDEIGPLLERCRSLFKGFDAWRIDRLKACFYTVTEDERFVVEKHGRQGLGDVALLRPWLQVRRADGTRNSPAPLHREPRSRRSCALGGRSGRR